MLIAVASIPRLLHAEVPRVSKAELQADATDIVVGKVLAIFAEQSPEPEPSELYTDVLVETY